MRRLVPGRSSRFFGKRMLRKAWAGLKRYNPHHPQQAPTPPMSLPSAFSRLMLACALALLTHGALAEDGPIGYVKTHAGAAFVVSAGKSMEAVPGLALRQGDVLRTGDNGRLGVTLLDNTVMSLGPNAEMVIDEYLFEPGNEELGLGVRLLRGTMQTGWLAWIQDSRG